MKSQLIRGTECRSDQETASKMGTIVGGPNLPPTKGGGSARVSGNVPVQINAYEAASFKTAVD
jgi:hypothetical protein